MTKNIKKSFKYTAYGMLITCAVIFGSSNEAIASDIMEKGAKFIQGSIIRRVEYITEDLENKMERFTRQKSDNPLKNALQNIEDNSKDFWRTINRRIIVPGKDFLKDIFKF